MPADAVGARTVRGRTVCFGAVRLRWIGWRRADWGALLRREEAERGPPARPPGAWSADLPVKRWVDRAVGLRVAVPLCRGADFRVVESTFGAGAAL